MRLTVVLSSSLLRSNREVEISTVIALLPAELVVTVDQDTGSIASNRFNGTLLTTRADGRTGKFDANGAISSSLIIWLVSEPSKIRDLSPLAPHAHKLRDQRAPTQF